MRPSRETIFAVTVFVISTFIVLGIGEAIFRVLLFSDAFSLPILRQPWRYADGNLDDDYWKLVVLFSAAQDAPKAGGFDPDFGWLPRSSPQNPLGIETDIPYEIEDVRREPVLFYGDSFVAGITAMEHRIPQILDELFTERPVLNYGVSGYGLGQIYLRFSRTVPQFENPLVLIGVLTRDLDRSILSIRGGQKPYFEVEQGQLILRNSPIAMSMQEYIESDPPQITSYFGRFALFRLRHVLPQQWFDSLLDYDQKKLQILTVNRALLRALKEDSQRLGVPLYAVIFYSWDELSTVAWREQFLKSTLKEYGIEFFDTKPLLLEYIEASSVSPYDNDNGHLDQAGNRAVAVGLANWLELQDSDYNR